MGGGEDRKIGVVLWPGLLREDLGDFYIKPEVLAHYRFANCCRDVFHSGVLAVWLLGFSFSQ